MPIKSIDRVTLLNITLIVEGFLLSAATVWSWASAIQLAPHMALSNEMVLLGLACGLALVLSSFALLWLGKSVGLFSRLRETILTEIAPLFGELTWMDALLVAAVSGFCEEILFRGVIQSQCGLWLTSFIFGLFHCPSLRHLSYGIWAMAAGLFLGWIYDSTGNLWVPILAHALSNAISLIFLRYGVKTAVPPS